MQKSQRDEVARKLDADPVGAFEELSTELGSEFIKDLTKDPILRQNLIATEPGRNILFNAQRNDLEETLSRSELPDAIKQQATEALGNIGSEDWVTAARYYEAMKSALESKADPARKVNSIRGQLLELETRFVLERQGQEEITSISGRSLDYRGIPTGANEIKLSSAVISALPKEY